MISKKNKETPSKMLKGVEVGRKMTAESKTYADNVLCKIHSKSTCSICMRHTRKINLFLISFDWNLTSVEFWNKWNAFHFVSRRETKRNETLFEWNEMKRLILERFRPCNEMKRKIWNEMKRAEH